MRSTQKITVRNSSGGADVNGTAANSSFISNPILMPIGKKWSLNVHFDSLAVTGKNPSFTIYVSNSTDSGSTDELKDAVNIRAPRFVHKADFPGQYMVIVYSPNGATAGTKFFDLYVEQ